MDLDSVTDTIREAIYSRSVGQRDSLVEAEIVNRINDSLEPFDLANPRLDKLIDRLGDKRVVCLGESTHGTEEFYRLRAHITERLIREKGFTLVGFEADFPDMDEVNDYIHGRRNDWRSFHRFPTWMWRNHAFSSFAQKIREYNLHQNRQNDASFFGLDLYSLHTSLEAVYKYFQTHHPAHAKAVTEAKVCLEPWQHDPTLYGLSVWNEQIEPCKDAVLKLLNEVNSLRTASLSAQMNARALKSAEEYYQTMFAGSVESWNVRDQHMFESVQYLLNHFGPKSKIVIWEHNSHLGNAKATQMGLMGEHNVGQLCKQHYKEECYLVGLFTHAGTVSAADNWGDEVRKKLLNPSRTDSFEHLLHRADEKNFTLPLQDADDRLKELLSIPRLERAVGVLYLPNSERQSHYFAASLSDQFDEVVWFNETEALEPIETWVEDEAPDTFPFGV
jgi:erythromycin esterase-like protein